MRHFPLRELGCAIGFIVLVAALYAGAYYTMVERCEFGSSPVPELGRPWCYVQYRVGGNRAVAFFNPMHEIDRRIRPEWWWPEILPIWVDSN